jgi:hypothetical protein
MLLTGLAMAATAGLFLASRTHMRNQEKEVETTHVARSVIDLIVRDLRLGGACLPTTGDFISLEGVDNGDLDEITTRTGLVRPDLSCVRSATNATTTASGSTVPVESVEGFTSGMRAYIRGPDGTGEYFDISGSDSSTNTLLRSQTLSKDYPPTSGVYAIDERRFFIDNWTSPRGVLPELKMQIGDAAPMPYAVGVEKLDIQYELNRNCPPCDVVDLPSSDPDNPEWPIVDEVLLSVTARSELPDADGNYYRRTYTVGVKPRNLIPH